MLSDPPDNKTLDRVLYEVLQKLIVSDDFNRIVDDSCMKVTGVSTPILRSYVRQAFQNKVGM